MATLSGILGSTFQGVQGEPGVGIPVGGAVGQGLIKSSTDDYATTWDNVTR